MNAKTVDVVQNLGLMIWPFCLSTELWEIYTSDTHDIDFTKMNKIPYFDGDSSKLSSEVESIPDDKGGVYFYTIENPVVPETGRYIMYVGRARKTKTANLRQRAKSHFYDYQRASENSALMRMYDGWAKYIYFMYIPLEDNDTIDKVEDELIVTLTPPCNNKYPSVKIKDKLKAFRY